MAQDLRAEARELEEASVEAAVAAGWEAVAWVWAENACAQIAGIEQLTKEVRPVTR
jgi:hypothetical protein